MSNGIFQAVILHTAGEQLLETQDYPMSLLPVVNKPSICYQLEYLLAHGMFDIMITVARSHAADVEKYLTKTFKTACEANIQLVVFEEEEGPAVVLGALEKANLVHADLVILEGNTLLDVPLDEVIDTHKLN